MNFLIAFLLLVASVHACAQPDGPTVWSESSSGTCGKWKCAFHAASDGVSKPSATRSKTPPRLSPDALKGHYRHDRSSGSHISNSSDR